MAETILRASRPAGKYRSPRTYGENRVCATADCDTRLSRYNKRDHCHRHAPAEFPRVRGVK